MNHRIRAHTPCELIELLSRHRTTIQTFLVSSLCDPLTSRGRMLEESIVLDRASRLVDALLRSTRSEATALAESVLRMAEDAIREGLHAGEVLKALNLLDEKVCTILREQGPVGSRDRASVLIRERFRVAREALSRFLNAA